MAINNSAGRLHRLLLEAYKRSKKNGNLKIRQVWAEVLDIELTNTAALLPAMARVASLPQEVEDAIKSLKDVKHAVYISWTKALGGALNHPNQDQPIGFVLNAANENVMALIAICDEMLSRQAPEDVIDEERLIQLREQVRGLRDEVESDNEIAINLKVYILQYLDLIEQAIVDYQLFGISVFQTRVEQVVGHYALSRLTFDEVGGTKHGPVFKGVLATLVISLVSAYPAAKELANDLKALLPDMTSHVEDELGSRIEE